MCSVVSQAPIICAVQPDPKCHMIELITQTTKLRLVEIRPLVLVPHLAWSRYSILFSLSFHQRLKAAAGSERQDR